MTDLIKIISPNLLDLGDDLLISLLQTLQMFIVAGSISFLLGLTIGVVLTVTKRDGILENVILYNIVNKCIDILRSVPFLILMILLIPVSRAVVGTAIGVEGAYVALIFGTAPFLARQIETVLANIKYGLIETGVSLGFSPINIIFSIYLKESIPGIARVTAISLVSLLGLTAMAGSIGAGGLGDFAIRYGYQRGYTDMTWITVVIILILVSIIQGVGNIIVKKTTH